MILLKKIIIYLLLLLIFATISVRLYLVKNNFSHIDDIGVAWTILFTDDELNESICKIKSKKPDFKCKLDYALNSAKKIENNSPNTILGKFLKKYEFLKIAHTSYFLFRAYSFVPSFWTYAPFQYFITQNLIDKNDSYEKIKIMGRLPSLIFGLLSIILINSVIKKIFDKNYDSSIILISSTILLCSWEFIVYSTQMLPYAIGVFGVSLLLFLLIYHIENDYRSKKYYICYGLIVGIISTFQYQILWFLPGYIVALFISNKFNYLKKFKNLLIFIFGITVVAIPINGVFLKSHLKGNPGVTHWNAGINKEFAYHKHQINNFDNNKQELFKLAKNIPLVIESQISPLAYNEKNSFIGLISLFFIFVGLYGLFKNKIKNSKIIFYFCLSITVIWLFFYFNSLMVFSPTRHSIILLPLICLLMTIGIFLITQILKAPFNIIFRILFSTVWFVFFLSSIQNELTDRKDLVDEIRIEEFVLQNKPNIILTNQSTSVITMPSVKGIPSFELSDFPLLEYSYSDFPERFEKKLQVFNSLSEIRVLFIDRSPPNRDGTGLDYEKLISRYANKTYKVTNKYFLYEKTTNKQMEWYQKLINDPNNLYIYLIEFKQEN